MGLRRAPVNERMRAQFVASVRSMLNQQAHAQEEAQGAALGYEAAIEEARAWLERFCRI